MCIWQDITCDCFCEYYIFEHCLSKPLKTTSFTVTTLTVTVSALTVRVDNNGVICRLIFNPYFKLKILRQINVRIVVSYLFIKYVIWQN